MNVIYLITHEERLRNQTPPYYYIGSKFRWKGEGTYFGSSRHHLLKYADKSKLKFEVLQYWDECTSTFLLEQEFKTQRHFNVVANQEYFNLAYACITFYAGTTIERRVKAFKKTANSVAPCGKKYSELWAEKAHAALGWDTPDETGMTRRERMAIEKRDWMLSIDEATGKTVAEVIQEKTTATNKKIVADGKTGYQLQGEKLSEYLKQIDPVTGKRNSELRKGNKTTIELIGVCFYSIKDAQEFFDTSMIGINSILTNTVTKRLYKKLVKKLGKDLVDTHLTLRETWSSQPITVCGKSFKSKLYAKTEIGIKSSSFTDFVKRNIINSKVKECLINYFGESVYNYHLENNSVLQLNGVG